VTDMYSASVVEWILSCLGSVLILVGALMDLAAAIMMLRLPNFYLRLHALTVGTIGGAVVPIVGAALVAISAPWLGQFRWYMAGSSIIVAASMFILGATGSHTLARAVHRSRTVEVYPKIADHLEEDEGKLE